MTAVVVATPPDDSAAPVRSVRNSRMPYLAASGWYLAFIIQASGTVAGRRTFFLFDDAMISMTYARNLAHGHGLVWNAGGPRVEGITNVLWTAVMTVPHLLGFSDQYASLAVIVLGAALCCLCGALGRAIVARLAPDRPAAAEATPWLVCFCYPLVYWTLRGMEVGLMTALLLTAVLLALRLAEQPSRADITMLAVVVGAGLLTRIDFIVFVPLIAVFVARSSAPSVRRVALGAVVTSAVATMGIQELARFAYYGHWLPNTYTLKIANTAVTDRVDRGLRSVLLTLLVSAGVAAIFAGLALWKRRSPGLLLIVSCAGAVGAYDVYVGGDAWEWMRYANRYLTPGLVLLLCAAAIGVYDFVELLGRPRVRRTVVGLVVAVAALVGMRFLPGSFTLFRLPRLPEPSGQRFALLPLAAILLSARPGTRLGAAPLRLGRLLVIGIAVAVNLAPFGYWATKGSLYSADDLDAARTGVEVASFTTPDAALAVVGAGNVMYFAHRTGVDVMGKSDARIAAGPVRPEIGFFPGHMKWNYAISIGRDRPDVMVDRWLTTCADRRLFVDAGYVDAWPRTSTVGRGESDPYLVLAGSPRVRWDTLVVRTRVQTADRLLERC